MTTEFHPGLVDGGDRSLLSDSLVSIVRTQTCSYPAAPFHPPEIYPELAQLPFAVQQDATNGIYAAVREALRLLEFDAENYGLPHWNPLRGVVMPGDHVVIKPNWVSHKHERDETWEQIVTHGSVLRPVLDYVQLALKRQGTISLADGPMLDSDFQQICRLTGVDAIKRHYDAQSGAVPVELLDLRSILFETRDAVVVRRQTLTGDPRGGVRIDLGRHSALFGHRGEGRYYGADYDTKEVNQHHRGEVQEYQLSATAVGADVIIDVPKLKSHHKVGVTLAMKGVVGLNCGRNWLPHRTQGTPQTGGDQFAESGLLQRFESWGVRSFEQASLRFPPIANVFRVAKRIGRRIFGASHQTIRGGGWHGNDTLWRMVHDINRALMYADRKGILHARPTKRRLCVVDGIVAGEGMGPVNADARACGVVLAGQNPVAVDVVGAELMGFDYERIPMLAQAFAEHELPLALFRPATITTSSNVAEWNGSLEDLRLACPFSFVAPLGWDNYVERDGRA